MKAPHFWSAGLDPKSRESAPLTRLLLTPLSALYTWGIRRKLARAKPQKVEAIVICIGNLTTGGVGKTPIVDAVRSYCAGQGLRPASLSRGYGGKLPGPVRVSTTTHSANDVGDEPLMLSHSGESWIGKDRLQAATAMAEDGVDVIVMDDGHQNPSLYKDLSIVVIDKAAPVGNGYVLPKGPLREPIADGLARAQAILLMGNGPELPNLERYDLPVLSAQMEPIGDIPKGPLVAFAGIGRPSKFFDGLKDAGADIAEAVGYADHYVYTASDLKFLRALAERHSARLITTTKDHARLTADQRENILAFPVSARFENETMLADLLSPLLSRAKK